MSRIEETGCRCTNKLPAPKWPVLSVRSSIVSSANEEVPARFELQHLI